MIARYTHLSAACSLGKWPRAFTALLIRALMDSIRLGLGFQLVLELGSRFRPGFGVRLGVG
jgi:hypothetical protein